MLYFSKSKDQRLLVVAECSFGQLAAINCHPAGGPPSTVGIMRLSGPSALDVTSRVSRPMRKVKKNERKSGGLCPWQPNEIL